jgi:Fic family protein
MAKPIADELNSVVNLVRKSGTGLRRSEIEEALRGVRQRTLQYWLKALVGDQRLRLEGKGPAARYWASEKSNPTSGEAGASSQASDEKPETETLPLSEEGKKIQSYVQRPAAMRKPTGYDRVFLDDYQPNATFYLTSTQRAHLAKVGKTTNDVEPAGTYAKQIFGRLLIDLAWNSSRLEGNTYSLLDTRRLIEFGQTAPAGNRLEAQMILNHKEAIEFLIGSADEIGFNRHTLLNLHSILAQNLLPDETAAGRLRRIPVGIGGSVFHPLETPQLIDECFTQILTIAQAIHDPFEQSLFVMVQLPYLQPFDDVNKRVSRLAANIPFIRANLSPLSFTDVPRSTYTEAILGVYEMNQTALLKDVFIWAYERSADRYAAVRQSLGEPDPFRQRHRQEIKQLTGDVIRHRMSRQTAAAHIEKWVKINIAAQDREKFRDTVETDLLGLHEGNYARLQIRPSEYATWQAVWNVKK